MCQRACVVYLYIYNNRPRLFFRYPLGGYPSRRLMSNTCKTTRNLGCLHRLGRAYHRYQDTQHINCGWVRSVAYDLSPTAPEA